jgi:thiamine-phosphate pyrophosphorylase
MDQKLLAWGLRGKRRDLPRLWLFTDDRRLPDPRAAVAGLPRGRAGVVLRHDADPDRLRLGRDLARICRQRRLILVVAGDARLAAALRAGVHLRRGRWPGPIWPAGLSKPLEVCARINPSKPLEVCARMNPKKACAARTSNDPFVDQAAKVCFVTSSAHSVTELRRAAWAGARLVFLSPAFPTASHAGALGLGPSRWAATARRGGPGVNVAALGGVDGSTVKRLPAAFCQAIGAIGALKPG